MLNDVQTRVLTWGDPFNCVDNDVIVCITGNPGVPDFYNEFASELHRITELPVCVVGKYLVAACVRFIYKESLVGSLQRSFLGGM